jgi:DNA-binding response OmpR family regulator
MARKILVVDDTINIRVMISDFLSTREYEVLTASDGEEALAIVHETAPDLILLDIMMPNMDGYQFISTLRKESDIPVIMITARQQEADIIKGFDLGADDYITKPFNLRELLVRLRAVLRRSSLREESSRLMQVGKIQLDTSKHEVTLDEHFVDLTPIEFTLLEILMSNAGKVMKRQDLSMRLMENGFAGSEPTLKIHIRNLRLKLGDDLDNPLYIETVFGIGYRLLEE